MRRRLLLCCLGLLLLATSGCSRAHKLHVYNNAGQDVTITVGTEQMKMSVEEAHKNFEVPLSSGTKIVAQGKNGDRDEVTVGPEAGGDIIFNVKGAAPLYLVD